MSFPRYSNYRDSGVKWMGELPSHWTVAPLKAVASFNDEVLPDTTPEDEEIEYLEISGVQAEKGIVETSIMPFGHAPSRARRKVRQGDIVISTVRTYLRAVAVISSPPPNLVVSTGFAVIRAQRAVPKFLGYALGSEPFIAEVIARSVGVSYPAINASDLVRIPVALPSKQEQVTIAAFLDRETGKIDALIEEQTRLIALLKEKRQAVISHAVTKGLNPHASTKDSGVEWLGKIPMHWEVCRLKQVSPEITVGIVVEPSKYYTNEGIPALRSLNVRQDAIELDNMAFISGEANDQLRKSQLRAGDLVAVRTGQPGTAAVIPPELDGCNCIDLIIIRKPEAGSERYLCWYLASDVAARQFTEGSGGAIQQHFNVGTAMNLIVAWPPMSEQEEIAAYLDSFIANIDALTAEADAAIALLTERRSALISAAVTGKIDVRGLVPDQAEAA
ncbi:MAG TPA: restriction endonuclease subunit S [Microvirga sp.]|nr:restriction endonuclease subunit S [Microvirga sp.]